MESTLVLGDELPDDLVMQAAVRLASVGLALPAGFGVAGAFELARIAIDAPRTWVAVDVAIALGCSISALAYFGAVRKRIVGPRDLVRLGYAYAVLVAFLFAFGEASNVWWTDGTVRGGLPWVGLWIALVPLAVPSMLSTSMALVGCMAAMGPTAIAVAGVVYEAPAPLHAWLYMTLPPTIAAVVALVPAQAMYRMARDVQQARRMGSYVLESKLGGGGMGEVWRGRHQLLLRPAAVKLVKDDRTDRPDLLARFRREAQATAALRSPHTVELYDYGVAADGTLFYAMELLEGFDLQQLVERFGPLPAERVVSLLVQVCSSLADAHDHGLVHRDIKPSNIMVTVLGTDVDFVKVLDFGLVKATTQPEDADLSAQMIVGTPTTLAPESITGGVDIDGRADLYSLGCVAFWLLTGTDVFAGRKAMAMLVAHTSEAPPRMATRTELPIPSALEDVVQRLLAKEPEDRYATARDVVAALREVPLDKEWTPARAERWWTAYGPNLVLTSVEEGRVLDRLVR